MRFKKFFELEQQEDGRYRCKGGSIADFLFLSSAIIAILWYWLISWTPFRKRK